MMFIMHIVGARPNFMKADPVIRAMEKAGGFRQMLVHTGQHYDDNMSKVFFDDLGIRKPDVNLDVRQRTEDGGRRSEIGDQRSEVGGLRSNVYSLRSSFDREGQIAAIERAFEPVLLREKPDWVFVYGDVNSTIACARVAAKHGVKIAHVEAGLRSFDMTMPEEVNRIETDQLADLLFVTEESGLENLKREAKTGTSGRWQVASGREQGELRDPSDSPPAGVAVRRTSCGNAGFATTKNPKGTKGEAGLTSSLRSQVSSFPRKRPQIHFVGNTMIDTVARLLPEALKRFKVAGSKLQVGEKRSEEDGKTSDHRPQTIDHRLWNGRKRDGALFTGNSRGKLQGVEGDGEKDASGSNVYGLWSMVYPLPLSYALVTLHRPGNVDDPEALARIMEQLEEVAKDLPVLFPVHPRTRAMLGAFRETEDHRPQTVDSTTGEKIGGVSAESGSASGRNPPLPNYEAANQPISLSGTAKGLEGTLFSGDKVQGLRSTVYSLQSEPAGLHLLPPLGYLDFLALQANAAVVITDSGGIQEETSYLGVPCLTVRPNTERPVTIEKGTNRLCKVDELHQLVQSCIKFKVPGIKTSPCTLDMAPFTAHSRPSIPLWDGHAAERIVEVMKGAGGACERL